MHTHTHTCTHAHTHTHTHTHTQVPPIDWSSDEGLVPEKLDSTIEFNNVSFAYPTRPDVQVQLTLLYM